MADSYSCNINTAPDASGNMYFRGVWEFCPEYKTGEIVLYNGDMYMCTKPHAGKDPKENIANGYWYKVTPQVSDDSEPVTRRVIDGGFATTRTNDSYEATDLANVLDGGFAGSRVHIPLI